MEISQPSLSSPRRPPGPEKNAALQYLCLAFAAGAAFISCLSLWAHTQMGLNNDHLVLLDEVRKLLSGATPYIDYSDVSPPLIHMLYVVPVLLAKLGLPVSLGLYGCTALACIAGVVVTDSILQHSGVSWNARCIITGTLAVALFGASFAHQAYGDRDHLLVVLAAPWLALYSPLSQRELIPGRLRRCAAWMAAVAFAIKPYFYIFYLSAALFSLTRYRLRDLLCQREHHIIWAFAAGYALLVLVFFSNYLFSILPVGLQTYGAIGWDWTGKWAEIQRELLGRYALPALTATLAMLCTFPLSLDVTIAYLYVLLLAALGSYALNYGWYYTQYPFIALALMLGVAGICKLLLAFSEITSAIARAAARLAAVAVAALQFTVFFWNPISERARNDMWLWKTQGRTLVSMVVPEPAERKISGHLSGHPRFMFFTLDWWSVNLLKAGTPRENVSRFDILWPLPGILQLQDNPAGQEAAYRLRRWLTDSVSADIERRRPDMLLVDTSPVKRRVPLNYNLLDMFTVSPRFLDAMKEYELVDRFAHCTHTHQMTCSFDVYYRK